MKFAYVLLGFVSMMALLTGQSFAISGTPFYIFGMSGGRFVYLNASHVASLELNTFHGSSESWILYIRANPYDAYPYDNLTWHVDCTNGEDAVFDTVGYATWNSFGYIQIPMAYEPAPVTVHYNSVPLEAKSVSCDFSLLAWNEVNNTANYTRMIVEMIPYYASLEFVNCTGVNGFGMNITGSITTAVGYMHSGWDIAWIVYSICIIVFAIVGIPLLVFIIIRFGIYRLTGTKFIEKKEY